MNQIRNEAPQPAETSDLADRIIRELLRIARQCVVMRFLVDEEGRQGGPVLLGDLSDQPAVRRVALESVLNELIYQGLIQWQSVPHEVSSQGLQLTPRGWQFVVRVLNQPQQGSIQRTINLCRCANVGQLLDLFDRMFYRLD